MEEPDFWDDPEKSQESMKTLKSLKDDIEIYRSSDGAISRRSSFSSRWVMRKMTRLFCRISRQTLDEFITEYENIRMKTLLSGEYDNNNAIVTLHAGAGGTESCDWCGMLYRMYSRWADKKGFSMEVLDYLDGDEAGVKSVTFQVNGENAFGYLKSEKGVHRLVRISPFNAAGKRQTSFVSCDVMPDIEEDLDVEIRDEDICGSIPTVPAEPADSISTRLLLPSVSPIYRPVLWYSVRMSVPSSRTKTRPCRC